MCVFKSHIFFSHLFLADVSVWSVWVSAWRSSPRHSFMWLRLCCGFVLWLSDVCFLWLVLSGFHTIRLLGPVYCSWPSTYSESHNAVRKAGLLIVGHFRLLTDDHVAGCVKLHVLSPHSLFGWCDKREVVYLKRVLHWTDLNFMARSHFLLISASKQAENVVCVQSRLQNCHKTGRY